ncbi:meiosis-specific protein ASY1 [Selaginella moellendorffii]|uniref:meiosis-specific protein ASY1 n=1 Tax=Selaginella moellendorffii TaxID=88036 RepID=UPI000D1C2CF1|nr:meiosis-specific protein ASY1 [Selaginella moellendorffii]|eukprot:XP_024530729.1 meiosis-specific protein ASY1 [Selaginella moellendorffii]
MAQSLAVKPKTEITEKESLQLTRNLLRIAVFNISYIRGLFDEKYFADTPIPGIDMKVKRLLPYDNESRRLIDWIEKGVYDALQKKYLRSMMFSICSGDDGPLIEEYEFSFTYPENSCEMTIARAGDEKSGRNVSSGDKTMKSMKKSVCRIVRTLIQLMRTLDNVPTERTIIMKLLYYDLTPEDYEPPFFRCCTEDDQMKWVKTPIRVKVGDLNSKHYAVALKVRSTLDPCEDENERRDENECDDCEGDQTEKERVEVEAKLQQLKCSSNVSTIGLFRTVGSEVTRHGDSASGFSKRPLSPTTSICQVQEPIYQPAKKMRSS